MNNNISCDRMSTTIRNRKSRVENSFSFCSFIKSFIIQTTLYFKDKLAYMSFFIGFAILHYFKKILSTILFYFTFIVISNRNRKFIRISSIFVIDLNGVTNSFTNSCIFRNHIFTRYRLKYRSCIVFCYINRHKLLN